MEDPLNKFLEQKFLSYADLTSVNVCENGEPMVCLGDDHGVSVYAFDERMEPYTGKSIYVREGVAHKLQGAQKFLASILPHGQLEIVYGYRHLNIQKTIYDKIHAEVCAKHPHLPEEEVKERVHFYIAVPEVSGHPTGGAVDVRVRIGERLVDMGTEAHDFVPESYALSPFISKDAWHNRQLLRIAMTSVGFAPFDGEWWHFSYGDREWAKYYGRSHAIYSQIAFSSTPSPCRPDSSRTQSRLVPSPTPAKGIG
ncbi:MAG: D-alanyl-D-alanine carboxypeptidase family protein [Alphaproteobacteria bacterium]|nr:MAG: D-alanyl-D-alanine carboxypeptidase family protein [Alphaproteobacteria bacterium]